MSNFFSALGHIATASAHILSLVDDTLDLELNVRENLLVYGRYFGLSQARMLERHRQQLARHAAAPVRIPSYTALKATGFTDPDRARQNLRRVLEGRPLVPYPAAAGRA